MAKLNQYQIETALAGLEEWQYNPEGGPDETGEIFKAYEFETFADAMEFVNEVAEVAEKFEHHPDIFIRYTGVMLGLSTHDEGGVTIKDIRMAERIEGLIEN